MNRTPITDSSARRPTISVVIPAYTTDRWQLIKKAVESVRRQTVSVDTVILCIDNNAELFARAQSHWTDGTGVSVQVLANRHAKHLAGRGTHEKAHGESRRFGAGSARNTAAEAVTSDIIAFMDDDAWAEPDWIEQLLSVYQDPTVVAVGGAPLPEFETGRPRWFPTNFDWVFGCAYEGLPRATAPLRHLIGANMSVRRLALAKVGGFHGSDFDDLNLCMRLLTAYGDQGVLYNPSAIVHHYVPATRVTWRYFYRRCYFVNREKVNVFRRMGSAANLAAERDFVWRALRSRVVQDTRRGLAGEPGAFPSLLAMLAGIGLAGAGHLRGKLDGSLGRDAGVR